MPPSRLVTRIAPTPSGFLHVGNAVNMLLAAWWAAAGGGALVLRIDDFDTGRVRREYLSDVFDTLDWLGIAVDAGPRDPQDFEDRWSMTHRRHQFRTAIERLLAERPDSAFVCRCSRRELSPEGFCVAGCRSAGHPIRPGVSVVRLHVAAGIAVPVAHGTQPLPVPPGDHVLWRRDDLPAYQLGSVVVDEELGVTAVVRGTDLLESTALQLHLAGLLPAPTFARADVRHHELLRDAQGHKLSKSAGARSAPLHRTAELRTQVDRWAVELGSPIGIGPPS